MTSNEKSELVEAIASSVVSAMAENPNRLTDDERRWVRLAIQKESQSIKLRQSIIEKTLTSLIWGFLVALGTIVWNSVANTPKG